jgi:hypothetical protein
MNLNFCVKWLRQIASGANHCGFWNADCGENSDFPLSSLLIYPQLPIRDPQSQSQ